MANTKEGHFAPFTKKLITANPPLEVVVVVWSSPNLYCSWGFSSPAGSGSRSSRNTASRLAILVHRYQTLFQKEWCSWCHHMVCTFVHWSHISLIRVDGTFVCACETGGTGRFMLPYGINYTLCTVVWYSDLVYLHLLLSMCVLVYFRYFVHFCLN